MKGELKMRDDIKFVAFNKYCKICKYKDLPETDDICNECLENPVNEFTDKPINYKAEE